MTTNFIEYMNSWERCTSTTRTDFDEIIYWSGEFPLDTTELIGHMIAYIKQHKDYIHFTIDLSEEDMFARLKNIIIGLDKNA